MISRIQRMPLHGKGERITGQVISEQEQEQDDRANDPDDSSQPDHGWGHSAAVVRNSWLRWV